MSMIESRRDIVRPLKVLIPLIKQDLKDGDEAAQSAGMPYYKAAGEKMIEAKPQVKAGGFEKWLTANFHRSASHCRGYMALARTTMDKRNAGVPVFSSLAEHERHIGRHRPTSGKVRRDWQPDVDAIADRARRDMERLQQEEMTRKQEREAEQKLGIRLIDIGYKVLAKELHPDSGGSREAMQRLQRVRDHLKASL
jgi:hypothetical protein